MNVYIWKALDSVSNNYHAGGGVVVIAETIVDARVAALAEMRMRYGVQFESDIATEGPTEIIPIDGERGCAVFIFPDAGCC